MNYLFRVDAGGDIGLGHFYRSINLAKTLKVAGHNVFFVHKPSKFWEDISLEGFPFKVHTLLKEADQLVLIKDYKIDVFYVDGIIEFEANLILRIKEFAKVVFYQNLSNSRYLADVFILPSIHQQSDFYKVFNENTHIYKGLEYFTFSEEIQQLNRKPPPSVLKSIAFIAGGSDPKNTLRKLYDLINFDSFEGINFTFFFGKDYMFMDDIPVSKKDNVAWSEYNIKDIYNCDSIISAFGVSTYEFLALALPIIAYGHQPSNADASDQLAAETGSIKSLGLIDSINAVSLNKAINELIADHEGRDRMLSLASNLLDLQGIDRVVKILEEN